MLRSWIVVALVVGAGSCGSAKPHARGPEVRFLSPSAALIAQERDVWTLEGRLVAEADASLRSTAARDALHDPQALMRANGAEERVRAYLRTARSAATRAVATSFLEALDVPTRRLLTSVATQRHVTEADVFMDYLTYDGLYDLAIMRLGYARWKNGRFTAHPETQALAGSFFAHTRAAPAGALGIKVLSADEQSIELDVFGAHVREQVKNVAVSDDPALGRIAAVDWVSNYEQLRRASRGEPQRTDYRESMAWDGKAFRVSYAAELDEYLTWNADTPWATMLYALSVDQVADLYAGAAATGGFEAGTTANAADPDRLPRQGVIGTAEHGLQAEVISARYAPALAGLRPRRGQFVIVTLAIESSLPEALEAPPSWFTLAAAGAEYAEYAVTRPALGAALLALAPANTSTIALPFTKIGAHATLVLVYDVPSSVKTAALVLGADELALQVSPQPPPPPSAKLAAEVISADAKATAQGKVTWLAREGAELAAGDPVARLRGWEAAQRDAARADDRVAAYERSVAGYEARKNAAMADIARHKVIEKRHDAAAAHARLEALTIAAPAGGTLSVVARAGQTIKAGDVIARIAQRRVGARFVLADTHGGYTMGSACHVARRAGGPPVACEVVSVSGVKVDVRLAADAPFAAGDELVLLPAGK
jgi:hypothetical protein